MNDKKESNLNNDQKYALLLNQVQKEILKSLKKISEEKSREFDTNVVYKSFWFNNCKPGNYYTSEYDSFNRYQYYIQIRDFFLRLGFIIYTFTPIKRSISIITNKRNMGFYRSSVSNVIFVSSICFYDTFCVDPEKSALSVAFHEFFNAISERGLVEYNLLIDSINRIDDFDDFNTKTHNLLQNISDIKLFKNEIQHRYLANNKDTKCMLEAIFNDDINFQPPEMYHDLYLKLVDLLSKLKDGI